MTPLHEHFDDGETKTTLRLARLGRPWVRLRQGPQQGRPVWQQPLPVQLGQVRQLK
ncbi:MAG: hypothetical protein KF854_13040 [Nitrospira sp.]|nr:hypothetical protein [Nitrospira sp.]MBX3341149.1 hypothetical protein [Nitrospira sp.]MBX7038481.1 hypothetical protein [Nitrospira sp.]MCW5792792.1 hypothetical protein [Nitrospira sp.]HMU29233.1 hypothetical protein [Nitrospira sp.]